MTYKLIGLLACLAPVVSHAETPESPGQLGFALNSSMNGEVYPIRLVPSATYLVGRSLFEAGVGVHPFIRKDQRILSGEFNYKYFPNGLGNALNLYIIGRFSYVNNARETYYPTTYHYLFLNGGYGLMVNGQRGTYLGTNVSVGPFAYIRDSENPYDGFASEGLFDGMGFNLAFQFNVGYRF